MAFRSLRWLAGGAVSAGVLIGACGYPDFTYGNGSGGGNVASTTSTTSTGGSGGTSSSRTSTTTGGSTSTGHTTSSTGGGGAGGAMPKPTVTCFDQETQCPTGQICCFDQQDAERDCDECAPTADDCGADLNDCDPPQSYVRLTCDEDADCAANDQVCCVHVSEGLVTGISCSNSCNKTTTFPVCSPKQTCAKGTCNDLDFAGYGYCQ
jgi:hypothetical protein